MSIVLEQVSKSYADGAAISDVSVKISDGEFFVLLGPSGSGKSTLLRAIAGLVRIDHGRIDLHGTDVTHASPRHREVGLVFQNYALFRHMTVGENIEFALRARRVSAPRRRQRRKDLLELVSLDGLDDRYPQELSGGQQQRVAVARALAHEPRVLLLDEPFGALDARIRDELRRAIRQIQRTIGITAILVTHDQEEAFTMADRIGVMDRGRLQEVGEPRTLYRRPATRFVATFLGAANLLLGMIEYRAVRLGDAMLPLDQRPCTLANGDEATVVVRPEEVQIARRKDRLTSPAIGPAEIVELQFVASTERLKLKMLSAGSTGSDPTAESFLLDAVRPNTAEPLDVAIGERVWVGINGFHILPTPLSSLRLVAASDTEARLLADVPLVRDLRVRMHLQPVQEIAPVPAQSPVVGLPVVRLGSPDELAGAVDLLAGGARQVLAVSATSQRVKRMLVCTDPSAAARDSALAAAASLARHLEVDAAMLVGRGSPPGRAARYKELLDLRSASLRQHGLDIRTELWSGGSLADAFSEVQAATGEVLLVVGLTSTTGNSRLLREIEDLLAQATPAALLLVTARQADTSEGIHAARDRTASIIDRARRLHDQSLRKTVGTRSVTGHRLQRQP
jgi:sulfate/thiosulfate transport system ATP-binding protein